MQKFVVIKRAKDQQSNKTVASTTTTIQQPKKSQTLSALVVEQQHQPQSTQYQLELMQQQKLKQNSQTKVHHTQLMQQQQQQQQQQAPPPRRHRQQKQQSSPPQTQHPALQHQQADATASQVKMSGYLKKKRNKMGGWRKMWFVLQNQLLLSYSSREDYEKKLVPFKDVLNLVPGTIIRPTSGPRFTIETTSNAISTFRCDDTKTCSEWITALLESLNFGPQSSKEAPLISQPKFHFSLDNLPNIRQKRPVKVSKSWDSICRSKSAKTPHLPMAENTAKILERTGLQNTRDIETIKTDTSGRAPNFRLHRNKLRMNQSSDVSRINSMFSRCSGDFTDITVDINSDRMNNKGAKMDCNQNRRVTDICGNRSIEEQIQGITLEEEDLSYSTIDESSSSINNKSAHQISLISSGSTTSSGGSSSQSSSKPQQQSINDMFTPDDNAHINGGQSTEPIYAVVDLKDKYARRAKIKEMEAQYERERPKSLQIGVDDYEEVFHFANGVHHLDQNDDANENIYEPIEIPELVQKNAMWRYFQKLHIDNLVDMAKKKKDQKDDTPSSFSDIRKKWGNHRKSIKNRMKKFYTKDSKDKDRHSCAFSDDELANPEASCSTGSDSARSSELEAENNDIFVVCNEQEKSKKSERHFFGSLGRLKKSRTSIIMEDVLPKKKIHVGDNGVDFQKELKKEINRRCNEKQRVCHSKFYD